MLRLTGVRGRFALPVCCVCGAALPLAFAPFHIWPIAPVCLTVLFIALQEASPRQVFARAWCFGLGCFAFGTYWTYISVSVFYGAPAFLGVGATAGLTCVLAAFFAVVVTGVARLLPLSGTAGLLVALPASWVLGEWLRSWLFSGFGWLSAGYSQSDTWLASFAPIFGVLGVGYAVALSAGAMAVLVTGPRQARRTALIVGVALWGVAWVFSGWRWTTPRPALVNVAIAQAAVSQDRKWLPEQYQPTLDTYAALSGQVTDRDLIVWPEVAVPNLFAYAQPYLESVQSQLSPSGTTLVTGILQLGANGSQLNSVVAMTPEPQFYAKRHLVPFGEYLPLPGIALDWLRSAGVPFPDIGAGDRAQPLLAVGDELIAVSICYEDVFGAEQRAFFPAATLIVNVANDAWFGASIAAEQHLQIARLRAAEAGRYVLRATNTGVSAIIDPLGNVVQRGPSFEPAVVSATVQGFAGATPYVRFGDVPVVLAALLSLAALAFRARRPD